jgi:hypothetical protein
MDMGRKYNQLLLENLNWFFKKVFKTELIKSFDPGLNWNECIGEGLVWGFS